MTFDSEYEPFFQPPGWVVGPIWAVLYTCMACSLSLVLSNSEKVPFQKWIIGLFVAQLFLNLAWPSVFNSEQYLLSLTMLVFMILFTFAYAALTYIPAPAASKLVWPYIAWMLFAALINAAYYLEAPK